MKTGESNIIKHPVGKFSYTLICHNKAAELDGSC
jgi:hypothetical protein